MPRPSFPLSILEFQGRFATEEACRDYLFASRWPDGFVCPACGSTRAGEMHRRRLLWQCKDCAQQTSATAGTVMHGTHTPLRTWFGAAYLVATHHPGISAKQLPRQPPEPDARAHPLWAQAELGRPPLFGSMFSDRHSDLGR